MATGLRKLSRRPLDFARGAANVPLSPLGEIEAEHLGARIAAKGGIDTVAASDLDRAKQTAVAVLRHNPGAHLIETAKGLEPWHQGGIEGMPSERARPIISHFAHNPGEKIPGMGLSGVPGESLNDFLGRFFGYLHRTAIPTMHPGERRLLLAHHSAIRALRGLLKHGKSTGGIDPEAMAAHDNADPASVFRIEHNGQSVTGLKPIDLNSDAPDFARQGLFIGRHGATPLNKESAEPEKVLSRLGVGRRGPALS